MKKCITCGKLRDKSEYSWRNKSLNRKWNTCKYCQRVQRADWYQRNKTKHKATAKKNKKIAIAISKEFIWEYLSSHPCVDCGESNPNVLEFDHVRGKKKKTLSLLIGEGYSLVAIQEELAKCEVRCANCHRIKTAKERGWFRE